MYVELHSNFWSYMLPCKLELPTTTACRSSSCSSYWQGKIFPYKSQHISRVWCTSHCPPRPKSKQMARHSVASLSEKWHACASVRTGAHTWTHVYL